MVLVGKVGKDIVMRINRHGQPAVGLSGDDGQLFRVSTMEGPGGEDIGFVGQIERAGDVIHHIAEDYIPVIASVGADRDGRSHNVNADEAAERDGAPRLGAYKVMFLTDVANGCAAGVPGVGGERRVRRGRGGGRAGGHRGQDAAEAQACVDAIHGGVSFRAHHRRPPAALAAARAVHGRRRRHQGVPASWARLADPTPATRSSSSPARAAC